MGDTATFLVPAMHCGHCVAAVTHELESVPGVAGVEIDLERKVVTVHGEAMTDALLVAAIAEAGYDAERPGGA